MTALLANIYLYIRYISTIQYTIDYMIMIKNIKTINKMWKIEILKIKNINGAKIVYCI
jgi:hypothetical protein